MGHGSIFAEANTMIIIARIVVERIGLPPRRNAAVVIRRGRIVALGTPEKLLRSHPHDRIIRCDHAVAMPGLVNVHAHLELPPLLLTIRAAGYVQWVLNLLRAKNGLRARDYRNATKKNIQTLLETGTTTVGEICTQGVSPEELRLSGIRSVLYHELIAMGPGRAGSFPPIPRRLRAPGLLTHGLSPHSAHTVSEQVLQKVRLHAAERDLPLCMHVAETKEEVLLLRGGRSGLDRLYELAGWQRSWAPHARSPIEYLDRIGLLNPRFLAVHAVHVGGQDIGLLQRSGASVAHCPRSNHALHVGKMPLRRLLSANIPVGLGTDSLASASTLNLWDEMRFAQKVHRRADVTARDIIGMATTGGASALGLGEVVGSLEPGKQADIILLPLPQRDTGDLYSDLLRETKSSIMTLVNGSILFTENNGSLR